MRGSDLSERAITAERELLFAREQLDTRSMGAEALQAELRGRLAELQQAASSSATQAAESQQALAASQERCSELQADLKAVTDKVQAAQYLVCRVNS